MKAGQNPNASSEWAVADDESAAGELAFARDAIEAARYDLGMLVWIVRSGGWSWQKVADVFGYTRQAAMKEFAGARAEAEKLMAEAEWSEDAAAELRRLHRRLGVRALRVVFEVHSGGAVVSRHYVPERLGGWIAVVGGEVVEVRRRSANADRQVAESAELAAADHRSAIAAAGASREVAEPAF